MRKSVTIMLVMILPCFYSVELLKTLFALIYESSILEPGFYG